MAVAGGGIAAVGDDAAIPPGTPIVEGAGETLLPGLIDATRRRLARPKGWP